MDKVVDLAAGIVRKCDAYANALSKEFGVAGDNQPITAFIMVANDATIIVELLNFYRAIWSRTRKVEPKELERMKGENADRVMAASKWLFIAALSSIEFAAKQALKKQTGLLSVDWSKRVYLGDILDKSVATGWITTETHKKMRDLLFVRNCLVHNNGISDENRILFEPRGNSLESADGVMLRGDLKLFLGYVSFACDAFEAWSKSFLAATTRSV